MEPKSLLLDIPLHWTLQQLKCFLLKIIPTIDFNHLQFHLHPHSELTLEEILARD